MFVWLLAETRLPNPDKRLVQLINQLKREGVWVCGSVRKVSLAAENIHVCVPEWQDVTWCLGGC